MARIDDVLIAGISIFGFSVVLLMAGLWWLPKAIGHAHQATVWQGAIFLAGACCFVFNRLPSIGIRGVISGRWFSLQISGLLLATAGFAYGALFV
jgi:hypothetical protein